MASWFTSGGSATFLFDIVISLFALLQS
jgi:hypothetical protein